jgi:hypothetical protein
MTHQEIQENEIIERYVRQKLSPAERQAFQEHYFTCDECFTQAQMTARFVAGVRQASESGVLAANRAGPVPFPTRWTPSIFSQGWARSWVMPALAACLLLSVILIGLWALSLRRQNQLLAQRTTEQGGAPDRLQTLETRIRELEAGNGASQEQKEALKKEISRLKEQLAATERQRETELAQLKRPDINVPVRNIYPLGDAQRSAGNGEVNQVHVPRGTRTFVLILGDYKSGYSEYRLEIRDPSGRLVATQAGLKPDQTGDLSVLLNRALFSRSKYRLKLYGHGKAIAEYVIEVE